jgi:hypothetical protein
MRRLQQVGAPHDIGDRLLGIVDHHCELVSVQAVAALEDEVAHVARDILRDAALHAIDDLDGGDVHAETIGAGALGGK